MDEKDSDFFVLIGYSVLGISGAFLRPFSDFKKYKT